VTAPVVVEQTAAAAQARGEQDPDDPGALPLRGMFTLAASAAFAVWTSVTCFVC